MPSTVSAGIRSNGLSPNSAASMPESSVWKAKPHITMTRK